MKKLWLITILLALVMSTQAQSGYFFGHYIFNPTYFNPSWGSAEPEAFVALQHRSQWLGYNTSFDGAGGAPNTQMLTALVPVRGIPINSVGINLVNDNLGPTTNFHINVPLTYATRLGNGSLGIGIAPSIFTQTLKFDELRFNDPTDPLNAGRRESQTTFDLSGGLLFSSAQGYYIGLGVLNIFQPGLDFGLDSLDNKQELSFAAHGGYPLKISDDLLVTPTVLIRSNLKSVTFDVGAILTFKQKMWTGLSYRRGESAILYLGYSILKDNSLKVGYSFDYIFQNQEAKAATTHELFLRFDLPDIVFGGRKTVKTPRFSF